MRVLGIDPGLRNMGWGVLDVAGSKLRHVGNGICVSRGQTLADRLLSLHQQLTEIIGRFAPTTAAVEQTFVNRDGAGTLKLGQARGVAIAAAVGADLPVSEYAARAVKQAVVGTGNATKAQVQYMVRALLSLSAEPSSDAADALAVAICHVNTRSRQMDC